jgi:hypothetical protein
MKQKAIELRLEKVEDGWVKEGWKVNLPLKEEFPFGIKLNPPIYYKFYYALRDNKEPLGIMSLVSGRQETHRIHGEYIKSRGKWIPFSNGRGYDPEAKEGFESDSLEYKAFELLLKAEIESGL